MPETQEPCSIQYTYVQASLQEMQLYPVPLLSAVLCVQKLQEEKTYCIPGNSWIECLFPHTLEAGLNTTSRAAGLGNGEKPSLGQLHLNDSMGSLELRFGNKERYVPFPQGLPLTCTISSAADSNMLREDDA